jgi:hypothetical protein
MSLSDSQDNSSNNNSGPIGQPYRHPNSLANLRPPWKKGEAPNPGGFPKSERVDVIYKRLLAMSLDELKNFEPKTGGELMAYEQFKRACGHDKKPLSYAQEITNRVDGPIVKQVNVTDRTALERERMRFDSAVEAIMKEEGCSRMEAAVALAMVNPIYAKYVEGRGDAGSESSSEQAGNKPRSNPNG